MEVKLGFGSVPKPQYVFVNKEGSHCWYTLEEDKQVPIEEKALTGIITGIECNKAVETQYGVVYKTDLTILAPHPHVIRSGRESYFSKSLLLSLDALSIEELKKPLTISVEPGDKTVVFCNIYDPATYQKVDFKWDNHKNMDLKNIEYLVSNKVNVLKAPSSIPIQPTVERDIRTSLMNKSSEYIEKLQWTQTQGNQYLSNKYGVLKRRELSTEQLIEFTLFLAELSATKHTSISAA